MLCLFVDTRDSHNIFSPLCKLYATWQVGIDGHSFLSTSA